MASGNIIANGVSGPFLVNGDGVHLSLNKTFGGGSVAVEHLIEGSYYPVLNEGVAIAFSAAADVRINVQSGDTVQLVTTGAASPDIDFRIAGARLAR